ncbi:DUF3883 domain-containing protein [Weeksellaceae bacterium KMM 9713]|uniref:DUF3883 domain-containing protein n=1 Tax=Profundicola chukchiensis TaxID=2961959 RepID=A0A9X4RUI8_9FLAO|nr:DUF3883 domain-containing protein [Profundicola chukchiensis]MDG4945721.1 DUF3883 domain-containing protein [Profundicola chukchiensis]
MINQVHRDSVIGIKRLSKADLGLSSSSNQTHIGLFQETLNFLTEEHLTISSQLIYKNRVFDLLSLLDFIRNPDGTYRSPKIRTGTETELCYGNLRINSVVREIRDIVQGKEYVDWYLLWLGLESSELVFLLFNSESAEFTSISNIVGNIGARKQIDKASGNFRPLIAFLNKKIEFVNIEYYEELEIFSQIGGEKLLGRIIPRRRDIEKANRLFKEVGLKGEELLYNYLEQQKRSSNIKDFIWMNQSKEVGLPYDFEITTLNNSVMFSDAKSTSYKFELPIILSAGELKFINENKDRYLIHRLYSINDQPKLRVCENIYTVSDIFNSKYDRFNQTLKKDGLLTGGVKLAVPTDLKFLNFDKEILLNSNN